jgi:hypothetical protein
LACDFAEDVDRFGFQLVEIVQLIFAFCAHDNFLDG